MNDGEGEREEEVSGERENFRSNDLAGNLRIGEGEAFAEEKDGESLRVDMFFLIVFLDWRGRVISSALTSWTSIDVSPIKSSAPTRSQSYTWTWKIEARESRISVNKEPIGKQGGKKDTRKAEDKEESVI